jgi:hypothetical protein
VYKLYVAGASSIFSVWLLHAQCYKHFNFCVFFYELCMLPEGMYVEIVQKVSAISFPMLPIAGRTLLRLKASKFFPLFLLIRVAGK